MEDSSDKEHRTLVKDVEKKSLVSNVRLFANSSINVERKYSARKVKETTSSSDQEVRLPVKFKRISKHSNSSSDSDMSF